MNRAAITIALTLSLTVSTLFAQGTKPIRDNVGFCWNAEEMDRLVNYLRLTEKGPAAPPNIIAAISPHDDYLYAARVYYPLYRVLRAKQVVIFGVTHSDVRKQIGDPHNILILDNFKNWPGPEHPVGVSPLREYIKAHLEASDFFVNDTAQALEHSIEALLPFLQVFNPKVMITPIMVTQMSFDRMDSISNQLSEVISDYIKKNHLVLGKDIVFLISSDANHYGEDFNNSPFGEDAKAHKIATANDRRIAHEELEGVLSAKKVKDLTLRLDKVVWCGKFSVPFGLLTSEKIVKELTGRQLNGKLLRYSDSYTESVLPIKNTGMGTTAPASYKHWCGWLSVAYYLK